MYSNFVPAEAELTC